MQESKPLKKRGNVVANVAKLGALAALVLSASCVTPRIEFRCPFPCPNEDIYQEELDGKLDDAPNTQSYMIDVEFECGCTVGD